MKNIRKYGKATYYPRVIPLGNFYPSLCTKTAKLVVTVFYIKAKYVYEEKGHMKVILIVEGLCQE